MTCIAYDASAVCRMVWNAIAILNRWLDKASITVPSVIRRVLDDQVERLGSVEARTADPCLEYLQVCRFPFKKFRSYFGHSLGAEVVPPDFAGLQWSHFTLAKYKNGKLNPCLFLKLIGKLQHIAVAFSAPLAFNSATLPLARGYSFDVPGGYRSSWP